MSDGINFIFWKQEPLLPRLLMRKETKTQNPSTISGQRLELETWNLKLIMR